MNRHYAGLDSEGRPTAWADGCSSWTATSQGGRRATWEHMELVEA